MEMLDNKPHFSKKDAMEILESVKGSKGLIGHFVESDMIVLKREFKRLGLSKLIKEFPDTICTQKLA